MIWLDRAALAVLGGVLAYAAFEWGGVLRTDQYHYLLVLGLLANPPIVRPPPRTP